MARIPDTTLPENKFVSKQVLTAAQLNMVYEILKAGVNANYDDIKRILHVGDGETDEAIFNYAEFDTTPTLPTTVNPGTIYYDKDFYTFSFTGTLGNKHEIGQNLEGIGKKDNLVTHTYKDAQIVTWSRAQGGHKLFVPAIASDPAKSTMIGVLTTLPTEDSGEFAVVSVFGEISVADFRDIMEGGVDTGITFGDRLYLSATAAGRYTKTQPAMPNTSIWVATVVDFNGSSHKGKLFVYPIRDRAPGITTYLQNTQPAFHMAGDLWFDTTG